MQQLISSCLYISQQVYQNTQSQRKQTNNKLIMSKRIGSNEKRAVSAHISAEKRQISSKLKSTNKKFNRVHTQTQDLQAGTKSYNRSRIYTSAMSHTINPSNKQIEEILQQNFHLKNELNQVSGKLYLTRSKIQNQKKKHLIYSKKLNREFQKQLYWPSNRQNDYLITGIKHQYEKLKAQHEQKCHQLEKVKKTISCTQIQEILKYCQVLQTQNSILTENILYLKKSSKKRPGSPAKLYQGTGYQEQIQEKQRQLVQYRKKIQNLEEKQSLLQHSQSELVRKVDFLQKLIIQKENSCYHSNKKAKNVEKQKNKLIAQLKLMEDKIKQRELTFKIQIEDIKDNNDRKAKNEKFVFERVIKEKNTMVQKLQKQIGYLSTLLSYWKPLDELSKLDKNQESFSQKDKSISNNSSSLQTGLNRQGTVIRSKTPLHTILTEQQYEQQNIKHPKVGKSANSNFELQSLNELSIQSINHQDSAHIDSDYNRQPRRSNKKWNEQATKYRKINLSEVQYLGEFIRYKMIAYKIPLTGLKDYFAYKPNKEKTFKLEEQVIAMRQIKQTFMKKPFQLSADEAFLLSRYIVQDEGYEYVYCHEGNQQERSIVKSIIKTLVGEYTVPDSDKSQTKWKQVKSHYSHNMQLALKSICPKGAISKDRFLELISSLGIQMEEQTKSYLIGRLVQNQKSLSNLKYDLLFTKEERICD